jgi:transcriptional regulator with XRE-family HTH domain
MVGFEQVRKSEGLTQKEIAEAFGVPLEYLLQNVTDEEYKVFEYMHKNCGSKK